MRLIRAILGTSRGRGRSETRRRPTLERLEGRRLLSLDIREFPLPADGLLPGAIVQGSDGNMWFTDSIARLGIDFFTYPDRSGAIARITPDGTVTEFPLAAHTIAGDLTAGADGNLWFAETTLINNVLTQ
jgi:streptogramin lyase